MSQLGEKALSVLGCLIVSLTFIGCGPSQNDLDAQATKIAAEIFTTQTAEAIEALVSKPSPSPTSTLIPTASATPTLIPPAATPAPPTNTPTPSATHTSSPTPTPSGPGLIVDGWRVIPIATVVGDTRDGKQNLIVYLAFENLGGGAPDPYKAWCSQGCSDEKFQLVTSEGYVYEVYSRGPMEPGDHPIVSTEYYDLTWAGKVSIPPGFIVLGHRIPLGFIDLYGLGTFPAVGTSGYQIQTPFGLLDATPVEVKFPTNLSDTNFLNVGDSFDIGDVKVTAINIIRTDPTSLIVNWRFDNPNQGYQRGVSFQVTTIGDMGIADPHLYSVNASPGPGQSTELASSFRVLAQESNIKIILSNFKYVAEGQSAVPSLGPESFVTFNVFNEDTNVSIAPTSAQASSSTTAPAFTPMCSRVTGGHAFDGGLLLGCENFVFYAFYNDHHIETVVMTETESRANRKTYCGDGSENSGLEWGFNLAYCRAKEQYGKSLGNAQPYVENSHITFAEGVVNFNGEFGLQNVVVAGDTWDYATASPQTEQSAPPSVSVDYSDIEWIPVPAGEFLMGSDENALEKTLAECNQTEGQQTAQLCRKEWFDEPLRTVFVDDFEITKHEITNAQYNACVLAGKCREVQQEIGGNNPPYDPGYFSDNYPVVLVNWGDAKNFCEQWAGGRLPTEAEWEKAARGTDGRRYPWGDTFDASNANLSSNYPSSVGSFPQGSSPYGVMDLAGNVFEWTVTQDDRGYIVRGGAWTKYYFRGRVSDRGTQLAPDFANYDIQ